ncbi:MAG: response regulator transcription factor [Lachnospiraceae bacterium]|nr:response regulator transcription factor [Lachnospiraceae bacterium]
MRLLLAEDEEAMSEALVDVLEYHRYQVDAVYDGAEALDYIHAGEYDGIILDWMMPVKSGLEVLRQIRSEGCRTPVLLLTARSGVEDRIEGLDTGADDYLAKPFHMGELIARVRAMLRRREEYTPDIRSFGDVTLNPQTSELRCGDRHVELSRLECRLMDVLMLNRGIYLSSEDLLEKVWGYDSDADVGSVWVYISYLRKQLGKVGSTVAVKAKRGTGYMLQEQ